MKKHNYISKTVVCLLAVSLSVVLFAGCQSQSTSSTANQTSQTNSSTTQNSSNKPSQDAMKKRIQDDIQSLITAGTITQDQANKIVDAMTTRNNPNSSNQSNSSQSNSNQQSNQQNGNKGNGQRQRYNPLSKLVSDGTITQSQADAVMQKVRGNFTRNGNHNGNQQNSQNTNNQSSSN